MKMMEGRMICPHKEYIKTLYETFVFIAFANIVAIIALNMYKNRNNLKCDTNELYLIEEYSILMIIKINNIDKNRNEGGIFNPHNLIERVVDTFNLNKIGKEKMIVFNVCFIGDRNKNSIIITINRIIKGNEIPLNPHLSIDSINEVVISKPNRILITMYLTPDIKWVLNCIDKILFHI